MGLFLSPMCDYTLGFEDSNNYSLHLGVNMKHHVTLIHKMKI